MIFIILANLSFIYFYINHYFKTSVREKNNNILLLGLYILSATFYLLVYYKSSNKTELWYLWTISTILSLIIYIDILDMVIPDSLVLILAGITLVFHIRNTLYVKEGKSLIFYLSGCILAALIFIVIYLISKGGIGQGDITLISAIGFILGPYYVLLNIIISFFLGAITSLLLLASKIKSYSDPIPFGPFIIISFFITKLYGSEIINWYVNLL